MLRLPPTRVKHGPIRFLVLEDNEDDLHDRWLGQIQRFVDRLGVACDVLWQMRPIDLATVNPRGGVWRLDRFERVCWFDLRPGKRAERRAFEDELLPYHAFDGFLLDNRMSDADPPLPIELEDGQTRGQEQLGVEYAEHIRKCVGTDPRRLTYLWTSREVDDAAQRLLDAGVKASPSDLITRLFQWYDERFASVVDRVVVWQAQPLVKRPQRQLNEILSEIERAPNGRLFRMSTGLTAPEVDDLRYAKALIVIAELLDTSVGERVSILRERVLCPIVVFFVDYACDKVALARRGVSLYSLRYDDSLAKLEVVVELLLTCPVFAGALDGQSAWRPTLRSAHDAADSEDHVRIEGPAGSGKRLLAQLICALPRRADPLDMPDLPPDTAGRAPSTLHDFELLAKAEGVELSQEFRKAILLCSTARRWPGGNLLKRVLQGAIADASPNGRRAPLATLWHFGNEGLSQILAGGGVPYHLSNLGFLQPAQLVSALHKGRLVITWSGATAGTPPSLSALAEVGPMAVISLPQLDRLTADDFRELIYYRLRGGRNSDLIGAAPPINPLNRSVFLDVEPMVLEVLRAVPWHEHGRTAGLYKYFDAVARDVYLARGPDAVIVAGDLRHLPSAAHEDSGAANANKTGRVVNEVEAPVATSAPSMTTATVTEALSIESRLSRDLVGREDEVAAVINLMLTQEFDAAVDTEVASASDYLHVSGGNCVKRLRELLVKAGMRGGVDERAVELAILTLYCVMPSYGGVKKLRKCTILNLIGHVLFPKKSLGNAANWSSAFNVKANVNGEKDADREGKTEIKGASLRKTAKVFEKCLPAVPLRFKERCKAIA